MTFPDRSRSICGWTILSLNVTSLGGLEMFFRMSRSREFGKSNISVSSRSSGFHVSVSSRSWRYNVMVLGLGFRDIRSCEHHAMHQACRYIRKKITDLTHKKQVVKWQTSPVSVFKLQHCGLGLEGWMSRLGLESLKKQNVSISSRSWSLTVSVSSRVLWFNVLRTSLIWGRYTRLAWLTNNNPNPNSTPKP